MLHYAVFFCEINLLFQYYFIYKLEFKGDYLTLCVSNSQCRQYAGLVCANYSYTDNDDTQRTNLLCICPPNYTYDWFARRCCKLYNNTAK